MKRTERESLQASPVRRAVFGWTGRLPAVPGCARAVAIGGAEEGGKRSSLDACPSCAPSLEAELYAIEDQRRTALSNELGARWT